VIYKRYERLIYCAAFRYSNCYDFLDYDDLVSIGNEVFMKVAMMEGKRFKSNYFKSALWWSFQNELKKSRRLIHGELLDDMIYESYQDLISFEIDLEKIKKKLTLKQNEILNCIIGRNEKYDDYVFKKTLRRNRLKLQGKNRRNRAFTINGICKFMNISRYEYKETIKKIYSIYFSLSD